MVKQHDCRASARFVRATLANPYRFTESGLANVFLSGIRYFVCAECGKQSAEIPAVMELMAAIARALVEKDSLLSGREIRFLRKRLGKKAADFASAISVTPETYSKWETGKLIPSGMADSLIRLYYALESGDRVVLDRFAGKLEETLQKRDAEPREVAIAATIKNNEWKTRKRAA